ncbi:aspartyl protease family protein [Ekhidna sp.]
MQKITYISALSFIVISCSFQPQPINSKASNPLSINFEVHHNILIVEAYVNDKWAKFIVDTGASTSILDFNQFKKYDFTYHRELAYGLTSFGGKSALMKTSPVTFHLKGLESIAVYRFSASDLSGMNRILAKDNQKVLGILGSDFLLNHRAIIDYSQNKIVLNYLSQ